MPWCLTSFLFSSPATLALILKCSCFNHCYRIYAQFATRLCVNDYLDMEIANFTDRCEGVVCKLEEKCVYNSLQGPRCVCRNNVDCPADLQPICGSDAKTYNNYCIMKATACREGKEVEKVADTSCSPGMSSFVLLLLFFF